MGKHGRMHPLKTWRKNHPSGFMSQARFAALIGVSEAEVSRYEQGLRSMPAERAVLISDLTGIPRHELRPDIFEPTKTRSRMKKTG